MKLPLPLRVQVLAWLHLFGRLHQILTSEMKIGKIYEWTAEDGGIDEASARRAPADDSMRKVAIGAEGDADGGGGADGSGADGSASGGAGGGASISVAEVGSGGADGELPQQPPQQPPQQQQLPDATESHGGCGDAPLSITLPPFERPINVVEAVRNTPNSKSPWRRNDGPPAVTTGRSPPERGGGGGGARPAAVRRARSRRGRETVIPDIIDAVQGIKVFKPTRPSHAPLLPHRPPSPPPP